MAGVRACMITALLIRLFLLLYSEWQDATMAVKYTDIDYRVFTDAARFVSEGESPYQRSTYRYTPLLSYMLLPNIWLHISFGKFVFTVLDLICSVLLLAILKRTFPNMTEGSRLVYAAWWLFNPLVFTISSRGNAEAVVSALVLASLYLFGEGRIGCAAIFYGMAVHFKLYPVIYALPFMLNISAKNSSTCRPRILYLFCKDGIAFALLSAGTFLTFLAIFYWMYGWPFLYETYLYHIGRTDNRHNFSPYFYYLYLSYGSPEGMWAGLLSFFPQVALLVSLSFRYYRDLPFCFFLQTLVFVAFNKVCTAQYFIWYITFLPIILPNTRIAFIWRGLGMIVMFFCGELHWLFWGYRLEFLGENVFLPLFAAGLVFFCVNMWIAFQFISHYIGPALESPTSVTLKKKL